MTIVVNESNVDSLIQQMMKKNKDEFEKVSRRMDKNLFKLNTLL